MSSEKHEEVVYVFVISFRFIHLFIFCLFDDN